MARKYEVTAEFSIGTTIEFDGSFDRNSVPDGVEEVTDNSYFSSREIETSGGEVTMVIVADDEYEAEGLARQVVEEGDEVEDDSGLTWGVYNVSYTVEEVEQEVESLDQAHEVLDAVVTDADEDTHPLAAKAVEFVFETIRAQRSNLDAKDNVIGELRSLIESLKAEVATLAEKVAALESESHPF